jgi:hypothetical protein
MADIRIIAGESRQPRITVTTDGSTTVDISSGYTIDWHVYREGDPDTVVVNKGTALSGDDDIDVSTSGASGIAIVTLTEADTIDLTGTYIYEWRVEEDSSGEVDKTKGRLIVSDSGHGA